MNDLIGYVIVILALVCGMAGFVSARRLSVMERDRTFEQVEIYRGGRQRRRQLQRAQTKSGSRLEAMLLSAGMAISPAMFLVGVVIAGALLGAFVHGPPGGFGLLVGVAGAAAAAWALLLTAAKKRSMQFETQLASALPMISENLRGGSSFEMSISAVAQFMPEPIHSELQRVIEDVSNASISLPDAFERLAIRIQSSEAHLLATAVMIQKEGGGNLASVVDTIAETIARRIELKNKVRSSTANARFSAVFVAAVPFAVLAFFTYGSPGYMDNFYAWPFWPAVIIAAAVLDGIGLFLISRMYKFKAE